MHSSSRVSRQPTLMDGGNYIKEGKDAAKSTCLIFSPKADEVGALARSLKMFEVRTECKGVLYFVMFDEARKG